MSAVGRVHVGWLLVVLPVLALAGCSESNLRTVRMQIGQQQFTLEVADSDATRQYGLMHRDSMPASHGMLFVFSDEQPRSFWMKHTRIPLDIIYVSAAGRVVSIKQMQPYSTQGVPSDAPAMYAIELNRGAAAAAGVKVGDGLAIPPEAAKAQD